MTETTPTSRPQRGLKEILIRTAAGSLGMRIAQAFIGVAISILLARLLGVEGVGTYAAIIAAFQMMLIPVQAGLGPLVGRQIVRFRAQKNWHMIRGLLKWSVSAALIYALISSLIILAIRPYSEVLRQLPAPLLVAGIVAVAMGRLTAAYHRGLRQILIGQSFELIRNVCIASVAVLAIALAAPFDAIMAVGAFVGAGAVASIVLLIWAIRTTPKEFFQEKATEIRGGEWFFTALTFMMISGVMQVADLVAIILTRALAGAAQTGLFQSSYQLSTLVLFGLGAITMTIAPYFAQLHEARDHRNLARLARRSAQAATAFAIVCAMVIVAFGEVIMIALYGSDFASGQPILIVVTIAYIIQASTGASAPLLIATGHERSMLRISVLAMISSIAASAILIPILGGVGTALGVVVSMATLNLGTWWKCRRLLGIDTFFIPIPCKKPRT